jgi:hypothetical protein
MHLDSETVLVVVSHYNARPPEQLVALLDGMFTIPSEWPFAVRVVVNQASPQRLVLPDRLASVGVCYRENSGYNIGAWDAGWRQLPPYPSYLFVQEECRIVRPGWVSAFVRKADHLGLVGECLSPDWDAPWDHLAEWLRGQRMPDHWTEGEPADRVACYQHFLRTQGIPPGPKGDHLQSLVLSARREVLEAIQGFPQGRNYGEAIAAEIGISKKVQALGLRIGEVGPEPFFYIEHPQWLHRREQHRHRQAGWLPTRPGDHEDMPGVEPSTFTGC